MIKTIQSCRICDNPNLVEILDLGDQALTGIFPEPNQSVDRAPLQLVKCYHEDATQCCGLVQLKHTYNLSAMYGDQYGYRSGLNRSMVEHLQQKVDSILKQKLSLSKNDLIIDIGSNDGTTLNHYPENLATLVGVDPTAKKFRDYYRDHVHVLPSFFSAELIREKFPGQKAKIITSFSMFYDLEDPQAFVNEVAQLLDNDGVWVLEQSYLPLMLERNSFDTICHEHLEYYALRQIQWLFDRAGLKILDVHLNDINGGSFSICAAKNDSQHSCHNAKIAELIQHEQDMGLQTLKPYQAFAARVNALKDQLIAKITDIHNAGKSIYGLGASTKGNVLLQYFGLTPTLLPKIGEVNQDKFGRQTPGTHIPIISEDDLLAQHPDYLLVLPWHFQPFFKENKRFKNTRLLFPLPVLEEIS